MTKGTGRGSDHTDTDRRTPGKQVPVPQPRVRGGRCPTDSRRTWVQTDLVYLV